MSYITQSQAITAFANQLINKSSTGEGQRIGAALNLANQSIDFTTVTLSKLENAYDKIADLVELTGYVPITDLRGAAIAVTTGVGVGSSKTFIADLSNKTTEDVGVYTPTTFDSNGNITGSPIGTASRLVTDSSELTIGTPSSVIVQSQASVRRDVFIPESVNEEIDRFKRYEYNVD